MENRLYVASEEAGKLSRSLLPSLSEKFGLLWKE